LTITQKATALLCINLVIIELILCVIVGKAAGSMDDGGWIMVWKTSLHRVQPCGKTINTCMNPLIACIMSFSSLCDTHLVSSESVEGEVSSIGAFPVIVRTK
jgi:hypothetical protein